MSKTTEPAAPDRSRRLKFWGVGVVLLMMVLMIFSANPLTGQGAGGGSSSPTIGTTRDGGVVTAEHRARALRMLDTLETIHVGVGDDAGPLAVLVWGPEIVAGFRRNPEALHLVLEASRRVGPGTSPLTLGPLDPEERSTGDMGIFNSGDVALAQLYPLPSSPLGRAAATGRLPRFVTVRELGPDRRTYVPVTSLSTAQQRVRYDALNDFLTLQAAASVTASAMKVSSPVIDRMLAEQHQRMTVRLASIDAAAQLAEVPEPSEAQLAEHFARYAGVTAGAATAANPFGFGYRVADRVRVEWLVLDRAAVRAAVEAEKTPYEWEVETRIAFAKEPAAFASLAPTTQATTAPAATAPATSRPTFESVREAAIRVRVDRAADTRLSEIERRIRALLSNDYQAWTAARATNATTGPTGVAAPIEAPDYLDRVAATVGRQFKITPTVERLTDDLRDQQALASASPAFASFARLAGAIDRATGVPTMEAAPAYAVRAASTRPAADRAAAAEEGLGLYQPSQTVSDAFDAKRAIFRVTDASPSRPAADFAGVRDRVVADWKSAQAHAIAVRKAEAEAEAEAVRANRPTSLDWSTVTLDQSPAATATLGLTRDAVAQLREAANDALLGGPATGRPTAALSVPLARRAYVAQRERLEPLWRTAEELATLREQGRSFLADRMSEPKSADNPFGLTEYSLGSAWLNVAKIYERSGWTPSNPSSD